MTSFYPAINGRATNQLSTSRLLFQIHNDQTAIQDLQAQLSTGRRITKASQDPAAAIRALGAQRQLEFKGQMDDNLQSADTILRATESTLSQAQSILGEIRGVAVSSVGTTLSDEERDAYLSQIEAAISKLTELGNSKFRDQYIFGGSDVLEPPLRFSGDTVQFNGNADELKTFSDFSSTIAANVAAEDAFGVKSDRVVGTVDINPRTTLDTPLSQLNRGDGIRGGSLSFSNGVEVLEIDATSAHNLRDVVEAIESKSLGGRPLRATVSTTGLNISYQDGLGGLLRIDEVGSGNMAKDLGVNNSGTPGLSPVIGSDLDPKATATTELSRLFGGAGLATNSSFAIQQGENRYVITTANLRTIEDLTNRIKLSGAQVEAGLDPSGRFLMLQSTESGTSLSIGENGGNVATSLGIRTMGVNTPISQLNSAQGIFESDTGQDLVLTRTDGTELRVNLTGVQTVGDVLTRINNNVDNFSPTLRITASLAVADNGIVLTAPAGVEQISVRNVGGSQAARGLGLIPDEADSASGTTVGTNSVLGGRDVSGVEVEGVFNSLIRLRQAIERERPEDLSNITRSLDADIQRMSLARGVVGTRQQSIDQMKDLAAEQQIQLQEIESNELDADLAQTISELTAREAALQASLSLMGRTTRLSLFDYI